MALFTNAAARLLLLAAAATFHISSVAAADLWVLALTHLDDNCVNPQRMSYFMAGLLHEWRESIQLTRERLKARPWDFVPQSLRL